MPLLVRRWYRDLVAQCCSFQRRTILSQAYNCNEAWEARKKSKALKDVEPYEFLNTLVVRSQGNQLTSAIDLDIAANSIKSADQLPDLEDILYKFRHSKNSVSALNSTHHALVRIYMQFGRENQLMRFLDDAINYGFFPDPYAGNMLMNKFLEAGNIGDAARTACFLMLQEEFSVTSTRFLMLYSCLKWLQDPEQADFLGSNKADNESSDDDEIIFRVPFLKNRYFDDHFDLASADRLVGKTLCWVSDFWLKTGVEDPHLKNMLLNCKLLGAVLWNHEELLQDIASENTNFSLFSDVIDVLQRKGPGKAIQSAEAVDKTEEQSEEISESLPDSQETSKNPVRSVLDSFPRSETILLENFENITKKYFAENEQTDIENLTKLYAEWNSTREKKIDTQIQNYLKSERLKLLQSELDALRKESEHMFFFENKEVLEKQLLVDTTEQKKPATVAAPKSSYGSKKKKKEAKPIIVPSDEDYVVPELASKAKSI